MSRINEIVPGSGVEIPGIMDEPPSFAPTPYIVAREQQPSPSVPRTDSQRLDLPMRHKVKQLLTQESMVLIVSVAVTTFFLGGMASYWAMNRYGPEPGGPAAGNGPGGAQGGRAAKSGDRGPQALLVRAASVQRKPIVPVRALVGDLIAVRQATIPSEVAGKVIELPVDEGTKVVGGETLLARIDDTWTKLDVAKIATQIAEKEARLAFERDELRRYESMLKDDAVPLSEAEQERTLIKELEASLSQLNVILEETQERISRLEIIAPFDGSVVAKHAEVGEYVPIGSQIVDIVSTGRIDARMMVPEESLPLLDVGKELDIVVDSLGLELRGKVFSINAQGSVGSRTFPVRVELDDQNGKLLPGMGVSVFVPVMRESAELLVPRDAVLTKPDGSTIWVLRRAADAMVPSPLPAKQNGSGEGRVRAGTSSSAARLSMADAEQRPDGASEIFVAEPVPVRVLSHTRDAYAISPERDRDNDLVLPGVKVVTEGLERLVPGTLVRIDPDRTPLAPVPGMYRTGQQIVGRAEE